MAEQTEETKIDYADQLILQLWRNAQTMSRAMLANRLGTQFDGQRDLYKTFGYPRNPSYQDFRDLYDRQGIAARIVEKFANDTWNKPPVLIDGESRTDKKDKQTKFIQDWISLTKRLRVFKVMRQADIMLGFSQWSVIVMGAPGELNTPVANGNLFYVQAFDESAASLGEYVTDTKSPNFALPKNYNISFNAVDTGLLVASGLTDASRVIHLCEDSLGSRVHGRPRLKTLINRLFDLEKVTGGGAEAAWLAVYKGVLLTAKEGSELPPRESEAGKYMDDQIQNFTNKMQRFAVLEGVDVNDLGADTVNIKDLYDTIISDLAGSVGIPQRILLGSERGNQASTQDTEEWNSVIKSRRTNFAEPDVLRPFINWCVEHKVIAAPSSGDYDCEWLPVYGMTQTEEATYANTLAQGANTVTGGVPEEALDVNEWRGMVHLAPRDQSTLDQARERQQTPAVDPNQPDPNNPNDPNNPDGQKGGAGAFQKPGKSGSTFSKNVLNALKKVLTVNSFPDHEGRPGEKGGSLPRDANGSDIQNPPWGTNAQYQDGQIIVQGKIGLAKGQWAVVDDNGKMAGNFHEKPEDAIAEANKFQRQNKEYGEFQQQRRDAMQRAMKSGKASPEDMLLITGRKDGVIVKSKALGIAREMGLRWTDANKLVNGVPAKGLTSNGMTLVEFTEVLEKYEKVAEGFELAKKLTESSGGTEILKKEAEQASIVRKTSALSPAARTESKAAGKPIADTSKIAKNEAISALDKLLIINSFPEHHGRPGERGGSLPRGSSASGVTSESLADEKIKHIRSYEPKVTDLLQGQAKKDNGEMSGMDHRFKTAESLTRKINSDVKDLGLSPAEATGQINDALRYTMVYDQKNFTQSVKNTEQMLRDNGYQVLDHKRKNFFVSNPLYEGYNTVWTNANGETFELQFHTPESLAIKRSNHKLYEKFRTTNNEAIRAQLAKQMEAAWMVPTYHKPMGYEALGTD